MILKNYNKQNHFNLDTGTSIKGVIEMTYFEWCESYHFLEAEQRKAEKKLETYRRDALGHALHYANYNRYKPFSIGVCGTFEIAKKYNLLDKYKNQNYAIIIN